MNGHSDSHTYAEILSQPEVWKETLRKLAFRKEEIGSWIEPFPEQVIYTGCGSTYYLSLHAASVWQLLTGGLARGLPASEVWLFPEANVIDKSSMLIAVSRSGYTSETINAIRRFVELRGNRTVGITCYPDQDIESVVAHLIVSEDAAEKSIAQTRAFTTMTLAADYFSGLASRNDKFLEDIYTLPSKAERIIQENKEEIEALGNNLDFDRFIFLGSGPNYGLACEAMIKMKEMTISNSEAYHFLEFRHGPKSIIDERSIVVGLLSDTARKEEIAVLNDMRELGAYVIAFDETGAELEGDKVITLESGVGEIVRGILALPILQLLAYYRALAKGLDPDHPKNLSSVVTL